MKELFKAIHQNAVDHGWWDEERERDEGITAESILVRIAHCHGELSEALEEVRTGEECYDMYFAGRKPEGLVVELADAVIRIIDLCEALGLDLEEAILKKHEFNKTRPYKHGKKI
jgi:NTP pyrophosphatase (non-canonical NTP hydrolase)